MTDSLHLWSEYLALTFLAICRVKYMRIIVFMLSEVFISMDAFALFTLVVVVLGSLLLGSLIHGLVSLGFALARRSLSASRAFKIFTLFLNCGFRLSSVYVLRAWTALKMKDYSQVVYDCDRALSGIIRSPLAYSYRGIAQFYLRQHEQAVTDLTNALRHNPRSLASLHFRGLAYLKLKRYQEAYEDFSHILERKPTLAPIFCQRGLVLVLQRKAELALADFDHALELQPASALAYRGRGEAHVLLEEYAEAIKDFTQVIQRQPDAATYRRRGLLNLFMKHYEQAREDFMQVVHQGEAQSQDQYYCAYTSFYLREYDRALEETTHLLQLDPMMTDAYHLRGCCWIKKQKYAQALTDFGQTLALDANNALAYQNHALAYLALDQLEPAWADLVKAHELQPQRLGSAWLFERWKLCLQPPDQAQAERIQALTTLFTEATLQHLIPLCRAVAKWITADYNSALTELQAALALEPEEEDAHFWLGMVLTASGRDNEAREAFERARALGLPSFFWKPLEALQKPGE